jgi:hypothetical protein
MRRITVLIVFIVFSGQMAIYSQIAVALHTAGEGGAREVKFYYRSDGFQQAYADAADGDTIYLPGGTFEPPSTISKQLVIFGAGHYPGATTETGKTFINGDVRLATGADHLHLEGLHITGNFLTQANNISVKNVRVIRCFILGTISIRGDKSNPSTNISFSGCVLASTATNFFDNVDNLAIHNSIINGRISGSEGNMFSNNIFFFTSVNQYLLNSSHNNTIRNSIFYHRSDWYWISGSTGNSWLNNIFEAEGPRFHGTDTDANNYKGVAFSPVFANQNGSAFSYEDDYRLVNPESYSGTDGTQAGIYGGVFPYREMAVPGTPRISSSSVSPTTNSDGNLSIEITVEAQNEN